jgi:site-specific recombinase XerD
MQTALARIESPLLPALELESARDYAAASIAPATLRAYRSGLADFAAWCSERETVPMPATAETVAAYLASLADRGLSVATVAQRAGAIRWAHEAADLASPTASKAVRATLAGIRRRVGVAPKAQKSAATTDRLRAMLSHAAGDGLKAKRDRALLLLGFAMAARRSELVELEVGDLEDRDRGLLVRIRRSKTDQEGAGHEVAVLPGKEGATCPVRALRLWLEAAGIVEGRVFRSVDRHGRVGDGLSGRAVAELVKGYAARAGLEGDFSGHSLRSGFVTAAADRGVRAEAIAEHTRHRSTEMVRVYTRRADLFRAHPGEGLL